MRFRFFSVPAQGSEEEEAALNKFILNQRIVQIEKQFVPNGSGSYWAICVGYLDGSPSGADASVKRSSKVDYREILDEKDFSVFAKLRALRKTLSEKEGVPPYALFTNDQLAAMVRERVTTKDSLKNIEGVGTARIEKYGAAFLELLHSSFLPDGREDTL